MKKAISLVLMVAMLVCLMPTMAFAAEDTNTWDVNGKVYFELKSGETSASLTAYDDYTVVAEVGGDSVNPALVEATLKMKGVAGLGLQPGEERVAVFPFRTGAGDSSISISGLVGMLDSFTGCTINGTVNDRSFAYTVSGMEGGKCVATPTGGEDAVTNVRSAWQELTNMITAGVATDEDSKIIIPAGTTIRIGTEELEFHDTCIINPSAEADNTAVVDTVRACAKLNTGVDITGKDNIEFQLKEGSELQVSSSFARLNRDVEITSNAVLTATDYLTQLKDSGSITHMVLVGATMFMDALGNASGQTVQVNIKDVTPAPAQYTVTAKDGDVVRTYGPFNAGETLSGLVDPAEQEGKIFVGWFDQDGNEVKDGTVVTKDLELTAQFKNAPYTITFSAPGPNGATLTFQRKADESGLIDKFPEDAKLDGYTFNGWFVGDDQVTAETVFTADTTVTAKFTQNPVNPPVGPTTPVTPVTPVTPPTNPENPGDVEIDDPDTPLDQLPVEEQIAAVQAAKIKTTSKMTTLNGKKAIKVSWKVPADIEALGLDGYQVFKSTKRYSGFGKKPIFETTKKTYTNNKDLVKGNTYYYKVRGYKVIEGKKYYTTWSTKAWRIL